MSTTPETPVTPAAAPLPDYIQAAKPNPPTNRVPWYLSTAPTYAGIFLWFVFWDRIPFLGDMHRGGLGMALLGVLVGGLICHFLFYLVPALFGMKTGLPLYIVGTSTFGAVGGLAMPGFLMGVLQFGWLAVNAYFSSTALLAGVGGDSSALFYPLCVVWVVLAAFIGLKGIQYVAKVATFLPLIPLAVLLLAAAQFGGSAFSYQPTTGQGGPNVGLLTVMAMAGYIVGFFATAGAAGVDFGMNNRDAREVQLGGFVGILVATLVTAGLACVIVAGAQVQSVLQGANADGMTATNSLKDYGFYPAIMFGLALAAFPGACFSSFIAANSFKTVMPRVNPFVSVGIGAVVSILLAVTKVAGDLASVFEIIGASFGPICGAMVIDYILAGNRWAGPRAGFNPAGWIAWLLGFLVGVAPTVSRAAVANEWPVIIPDVPAAPIAAFMVGAIVYYILAKVGLQSPVLPYAPAAEQQTA
jgi:cytosine permease